MTSSVENSDLRSPMPWRMVGWGGAATLLVVPLVCGFAWTAFDYLFAAAMLGLVGGAFEFAVRRSGNAWYRGGVAAAILTAFLLVWINGAVGIIGSEDNPANLLFFGVIAVAIAGALVARFQAQGMARAMPVAAALQALIGLWVILKGTGYAEPLGPLGLLVLIEGFAGVWLMSAWMFRRAARS